MEKVSQIPFNKPYLSGKELEYIQQAVASGKISGDGMFTRKCHDFFEQHYGFKKALLTTSCTDALEMSAILLDIEPGDEIIAPSYTFVSTINPFILRGAIIKFVDSYVDNPNIDPAQISAAITPKTKAIVVVHYAGIACDMDEIQNIASQNNLHIIEDAAQAIDSHYKGKPLGSFGLMSAFSFHETKNIIAGEGGLVVINNEKLSNRAEIIREKGTNRSQFFRGEIDKYGWVDIGSSFLPSELIAAYLFAQLEQLQIIQEKRISLWNGYEIGLQCLVNIGVSLPTLPEYATNNGHMFYLVCNSLKERTALIAYLKSNGIMATFHYQSLHKSPYFEQQYVGNELINADRFSDCLVRLPMYYELTEVQQQQVINCILEFYKS